VTLTHLLHTHRTGFHRVLVTQLDVSAPSPYNQDAVCHVALLQRLPREVYVDQYETSVARVTRSRQAGDDAAIVRVFGAYQVERPAPECESSLVAVTVRAERSAMMSGVVRAYAAVPIHARYPAPAQLGESMLLDVDIPVPVAFIRCGGEDALWQQVIQADGDNKVITWKVRALPEIVLCGCDCL
jgi:PIG-X / PBN1